MSWAGQRPLPLATSERATLDTLGRSRRLTTRRWAWLIGMSDADDARLIDWAKSFATPPSVDLKGARIDLAGYASERRAICLEPLASEVQIHIKPNVALCEPSLRVHTQPWCDRPPHDRRPCARCRAYAWDGRALWLDATDRDADERANRVRLTRDARAVNPVSQTRGH